MDKKIQRKIGIESLIPTYCIVFHNTTAYTLNTAVMIMNE
jgi:hypothetical protein